MKVVIKRISCFFLAFALIFIVTFSCFNRPVKTHADVLSALALGSGALGALVCAYMATAGVQLTGSSDADGSFLGNYVANWVKSSSSFPNNSYFNSDGEFIGSSTDLSIVQNTNTGLVSFIFGKEFAIWLETIKQSFVSQNNIPSSGTTSIVNNNYINIGSNRYPVFRAGSNISNRTPFPTYPAQLSLADVSVRGSNLVQIAEGLSYNCEVTRSDNSYFTYYNALVESNGNVTYQSSYWSLSTNHYSPADYLFVGFYLGYNEELAIGPIYNSNGYCSNYNGFGLSSYINSSQISEMSLEGSLTDGYEDFEDAINNDLTNADEDEVVVVDVGTFPNVLDPSLLVPDILDRAVVGELNPTYEGTREDTGTAEDEKDNEKPFSPTVPEGWVIVNGLEDFFPFCIPWDLYNLIAELNVPAVAPKFKYKVDLDAAIDGLEYEAELDLAPFETVANVFRIIVVIGFVFFLILKTRDLIRG